jgi:hypothetical protein
MRDGSDRIAQLRSANIDSSETAVAEMARERVEAFYGGLRAEQMSDRAANNRAHDA